MKISELILFSISRKSGSSDYVSNDSQKNIDNSLDLFARVYPNFSSLVSGKHIIDFGCGVGCQSIALAKKYDCSIVGIDNNKKTLKKALSNAVDYNISSQKLLFVENILPEMLNGFDVVISQNSFEHFESPDKILKKMSTLLNASGIILLTFGPPWFAPYGSHMHFFCKVPWINVIFSEKTVMKVRGSFRDDGAKKYEEVESGLNKMSVAKFESIISSCGLRVKYRKYECVKGINWLSRIPLLREFFINHVTVILSKEA